MGENEVQSIGLYVNERQVKKHSRGVGGKDLYDL